MIIIHDFTSSLVSVFHGLGKFLIGQAYSDDAKNDSDVGTNPGLQTGMQ